MTRSYGDTFPRVSERVSGAREGVREERADERCGANQVTFPENSTFLNFPQLFFLKSRKEGLLLSENGSLDRTLTRSLAHTLTRS